MGCEGRTDHGTRIVAQRLWIEDSRQVVSQGELALRQVECVVYVLVFGPLVDGDIQRPRGQEYLTLSIDVRGRAGQRPFHTSARVPTEKIGRKPRRSSMRGVVGPSGVGEGNPARRRFTGA